MKSIFSSSSAKALHGGLNLSNLLTLHISVPMVIRIERRINGKQRVSVRLTSTSDALLHISTCTPFLQLSLKMNIMKNYDLIQNMK